MFLVLIAKSHQTKQKPCKGEDGSTEIVTNKRMTSTPREDFSPTPIKNYQKFENAAILSK
jgi:hypothetical protein